MKTFLAVKYPCEFNLEIRSDVSDLSFNVLRDVIYREYVSVDF